jgi:hypothetical protein
MPVSRLEKFGARCLSPAGDNRTAGGFQRIWADVIAGALASQFRRVAQRLPACSRQGNSNLPLRRQAGPSAKNQIS